MLQLQEVTSDTASLAAVIQFASTNDYHHTDQDCCQNGLDRELCKAAAVTCPAASSAVQQTERTELGQSAARDTPRLSIWACRRSWRWSSCLRASLSASLCLSSCRHLCCRACTSVSLHNTIVPNHQQCWFVCDLFVNCIPALCVMRMMNDEVHEQYRIS